MVDLYSFFYGLGIGTAIGIVLMLIQNLSFHRSDE